MGKPWLYQCIACVLALVAPAANAEDRPKANSDYDALVEELPIKSDVFGPALTFTNPRGGVTTFYGQINPTYQSFDDGQQTTGGLVDNGNWNTRLGFTIIQPLDSVTLRARFETGLGLRNSAAVSQDFTPQWIDWQRTALRWFEVAVDSDYGTLSLGQGSTASNRYINFSFGAGEHYDTVVLTSIGYAFESDNHAFTPVPLPAAAWLLLSGLVGFAALGRRKAAV